MASVERYKPLKDDGIIGNCRSAALVGRDGSIDWLCFPRFDSPSVFAALLDAHRGGRFLLSPRGPVTAVQRYREGTNILEVLFRAEGGACRLVDCMPLYRGPGGRLVERYEVVRLVRWEEGSVLLEVDYAPRPDYARSPVSLIWRDGALVCPAGEGEGEVPLLSPVPLEVVGDRAVVSFTLQEGEEAAFVLSYSGPWREVVVRSYLVLHLLTYIPTGALVAAPTTSLPKWVGGVRNWDYRYTWLRDAAFTVDALLALGHRDEALPFFSWLCRVCERVCQGEPIQIMYRIDGTGDLWEEELPHLEGYRGSRPVRIGNGAFTQSQHDIYGEVVDTLAHLAQARWRLPGNGLWEVRGGPYHFVSSKVMCWAALERASHLARLTGRWGPTAEGWARAAEEVRAEVLERGFNPRKGSFVQHYDTETVDASALLIPLVGFLPPDDPRVLSTLRRVRQELGQGPFLHRYRTEETDDGLSGPEGAFTLCGFWLVQVLARLGRREEARRLLDDLLSYASPLGLFAEMVDPQTGEALGNFPQAFTHLGLIQAALECDEGNRDPGASGGTLKENP